jgi:hypothetical protein
MYLLLTMPRQSSPSCSPSETSNTLQVDPDRCPTLDEVVEGQVGQPYEQA